MLPDSRVYSFLDNARGFTVHFLEGQKIISDLILMHHFKRDGFSFFRDTVLTSLQIINFLKPGENIGYYIDSPKPFFGYKIELNHQGNFRTLLLPKDFDQSPKTITGQLRLTKIIADSKSPYSSVVEINNETSGEIFNVFMKSSFQTNGQVLLSQTSDQSVMINKLPPKQVDKEIMENDLSLSEFITDFKIDMAKFFSAGHTDIEEIVKHFESIGFSYLQSKKIDLYCPCSKDQFAFHMSRLPSEDLDDVFKDGDAHISCDYCNKDYYFSRTDLTQN
jgi:molecular chaperone Hsp33